MAMPVSVLIASSQALPRSLGVGTKQVCRDCQYRYDMSVGPFTPLTFLHLRQDSLYIHPDGDLHDGCKNGESILRRP
jgi:hypothetical protein